MCVCMYVNTRALLFILLLLFQNSPREPMQHAGDRIYTVRDCSLNQCVCRFNYKELIFSFGSCYWYAEL